MVLLLVLAFVGIAAADVATASFVRLAPGTTFGVRADPSITLPDDEDCDEPCPRNYSFLPDSDLLVRMTVRNEGPLPITFDGLAQAWLDDSPSLGLAKPVGTFDPGDPDRGLSNDLESPFTAVTLGPGDQWSLGIIVRTADQATGCEDWVEGSAMTLDTVRIAWHWLATRHEQEIELVRPLRFAAPRDSECPSRGDSG